jgi:hypothetical protein
VERRRGDREVESRRMELGLLERSVENYDLPHRRGEVTGQPVVGLDRDEIGAKADQASGGLTCARPDLQDACPGHQSASLDENLVDAGRVAGAPTIVGFEVGTEQASSALTVQARHA